MKSNCYISVLMPVYNGGQYLSEALESVLDQTFTDFEFIIINDGSTDNSKKILKGFAVEDERIRYFENKNNLGLVKTLNRGLKLAKGKYIARMDADDLCLPERFQKQFDFMESHPEVAICGTSFKSFGARNATHIYPENHEQIKAGLIYGSCICHPSVFFRNAFIQEHDIEYIQETFPAEDYKIWVKAARVGQLYNLPDVLIKYREHETQISTENKLWQKNQTDKIRIEMLEYLSGNFSDEEKDYHLNVFIPGEVYTKTDLKKFTAWPVKLLEENRKNSKFDDTCLRERFKGHKYNIYLRRVHEIYFAGNIFTPGRMMKYIGSAFFCSISPKQNLKLFIKSLQFKTK